MPDPTPSPSRALWFAAIAIVAILVGFLSAQFFKAPGTAPIELSNGTWLPGGRPLPEFKLIDSKEQAFSRAQLRGRWSVLFFGFTSCPDICPTTLSMMAQLEQAMADLPEAQHPQMVFVSVDPKRDNPAQIAKYIQFFSSKFIGLTGTPAQLDQFTRAMGVPVVFHDLGNGAYSVDHAATLFLIDPQANLSAVFSPPHTVAMLNTDLRRVINSDS